MTKKKKRMCMEPGCTQEAQVRLKGLDREWLCSLHATIQIHQPENIAMTEADHEMQEYRKDGGRLN